MKPHFVGKVVARIITPPKSERRSEKLEAEVKSMKGVTAEAEEDLESTDKWAIPQEIAGELTPAPMVGPSKRAPDRHLCRTVASPIPAMLAETMGLAEERDGAVPSPPSQAGTVRR